MCKMRMRTALFMTTMGSTRSMVSFHGHTFRARIRAGGAIHRLAEEPQPPPPNPNQFLSPAQQSFQIQALVDWFHNKSNVLCLTGAGVSTDSGIADYRGHQGAYHKGHKPMVHDQFVSSEDQRKRYWGRGMVGWKPFEAAQPNAGHLAIAQLEHMGKLGVEWDTSLSNDGSSPQQTLALVTQNVDSLHRRAGSQDLVELHGTSGQVKCLQCGTQRDRYDFHAELEDLNREWLEEARAATDSSQMRPDGDAAVAATSYSELLIPPCTNCGSFVKPDVVFFGDSVPLSRVERVQAAVDHCDGLLVVGSSLAVHSAFRHVRAACAKNIPVAILNVGETRAEAEQLDVLKIEAPIGSTLAGVVSYFQDFQEANQ